MITWICALYRCFSCSAVFHEPGEDGECPKCGNFNFTSLD